MSILPAFTAVLAQVDALRWITIGTVLAIFSGKPGETRTLKLTVGAKIIIGYLCF